MSTSSLNSCLERVANRVRNNSILTRFWRTGNLLANPDLAHPWNQVVPAEWDVRDRMFLLTTDLNPATLNNDPPAYNDEIPVFALARELGTTPNREWLVYCHSPKQDRTGVVISHPNFDADITVNVDQAGNFYFMTEGEPGFPATEV